MLVLMVLTRAYRLSFSFREGFPGRGKGGKGRGGEEGQW